MYLDPQKKIVHDNNAYTASNGTKYPANYPKDEISELTKVKTVVAPDGKVVGGYVVDASNNQVWESRDKTTAEVKQEALNLVYEKRRENYGSWENQLDMLYHDLMAGTSTFKDHITAVKLNYPKPT